MAAPQFDDEFDEEEEDDGLAEVSEDDTDVVFGNSPINRPSMVNFINKYPDSALRFLTRRDLDGRPVRSEFEPIYEKWADRGLMKGRVKKYILTLMEWDDLPDRPLHELVGDMRNKLAEMRLTGEA